MDPIERLGVKRTKDTIKQADLIVGMVAPETETIDDTRLWLEALPQDKPFIWVANKSDRKEFADYFQQLKADLLPHLHFSDAQMICHDILGETYPPLVISTRKAGSLNLLKKYIVALYDAWGSPSEEGVILTSERHYDALVKASNQLEFIAEDIDGLPLDIFAQSLKSVAEQLALIIGDKVTDAVIDEVFSRFCVGK